MSPTLFIECRGHFIMSFTHNDKSPTHNFMSPGHNDESKSVNIMSPTHNDRSPEVVEVCNC